MSPQTAFLACCSLILLMAVAIGTPGTTWPPGERGIGRIDAALR